jgi:tetratricopeptide (TPR) repeat protein
MAKKKSRKPLVTLQKPEPKPRGSQFIAYIVIALTAFIIYANTLGHGYVLDDRMVIIENRFVHAGFNGVPDLLRYDSMRGYLDDDTRYLAGGRYRPLSMVLFAATYQFFGMNPAVGHFIAIALYALCAMLLYTVLNRLLPLGPDTRRYWSVPMIATMLFTLHPVHTEVVANIKSCDEILALLGALAAWYVAIRSVQQPRIAWLIGSGASFFLALLAKESAITFLPVVPLALVMFLRQPLRRVLTAISPLLIASALFVAIRFAVVGFHSPQTHELLNNPFIAASGTQKWATIARALWEYARLLVFPHPLTYDYYPYQIPLVYWTDWRALGAVALYAGLLVYALRSIRSVNPIAFGIILYLCTLSIVSNLVFPVGTFMAERFLFAPSIGYTLALAAAGIGLQKRVPAWLVPMILVAVAAFYTLKTVSRNTVWKSDEILTATDVKVSANSASANASAADFLIIRAQKAIDPRLRQSLIDTAFNYLHRAIRIHPRYERAYAMIAENYDRLKSNPDSALYFYRRLYEFSPAWPNVAYNLGTLRLMHKPAELDSAGFFLGRATQMFPMYAGAWKNLGVCFFYRKEYPRAGECFAKAFALDPNDRSALTNAITAYNNAGDTSAVRRLSGR